MTVEQIAKRVKDDSLKAVMFVRRDVEKDDPKRSMVVYVAVPPVVNDYVDIADEGAFLVEEIAHSVTHTGEGMGVATYLVYIRPSRRPTF